MPSTGLFRILLAFFLLLLLSRGAVEGGWLAYAAVVLAAGFGGMLAFGRPAALFRERLVIVLADALMAALLVAGTGGPASPLFPLFFLAALGIPWTASPGRMALGSLALPAGYLAAVGAAAGDPAAAVASGPLLWAALIGAFCAGSWFLGLEIAGLREHNARLARAHAHEKGSMERVREAVSRLSPMLAVSDLDGILRWAAGVAAEITRAPYAHVAALDKYRHQTVAGGEYDSYPSWWHPEIQRLVLRSAREGKVLRREGRAGELEGLTAIPLVSGTGEGWGAVVVAGAEVGPDQERVLKLLAGQVATAVERNSGEAPGGRDPVSGVPNQSSFQHVLRQELVREGSLTVLAVDIEHFRHYNSARGPKAGDELLRSIGRELERRQRRVFRLRDDEFAVILSGSSRLRAQRTARGIQRLVAELTSASGVPLRATVGYTLLEESDRDPDLVLDAVLGGLEQARSSPERVAELPVGARVRYPGGAQLTDVLLSLAEAADVRDSYTGGHMRAVARLSGLIGRELGLPPEEVEILTVAALLHDVGKIGIPDSILSKPGRLTPEEFEIVRTHPDLGVQILKFVRGLEPVLPAVRHHHERYDGRGYPDGLRGEEIPRMARIIFVADSYDAMVRDRAYRRGMPPEMVVEEIRRNAGTQFDPEVVRAFLRVFREETGHRSIGSAG